MKTKKLVVSAMLTALGSVLSLYAVYRLPTGGAVTLASMVPVIMISFLSGTKHGLLSAMVYALIQAVTGFYAPPVQNFISFVTVILFDYVFAFAVLGFADTFWKALGRRKWAIAVCGAFTVFLRFLCHIVSGVAIWSVYAPEGQSPLMYSLIYNGSYMLPEIIITAVVLISLSSLIFKLRK